MDNFSKIEFLNLVISLLPKHFCLDVSRFIACQFALESNFGISSMSLCNNNYCGMKVPTIRLTICQNHDNKGDFAVYAGIASCVYDYLIWLTYNKFSRYECNNLTSFIKHLNLSGYCPEPDYIDRIQSIYKQYYSSKN